MSELLAVGSLYVAPKVFNYLYKKPSELELHSLFYRIRLCLSEGLESTAVQLGEKGCFVCNEMIGDNAWISAFVICLILRKNPSSEKCPIEILSALACGSVLVWLIRYAVAAGVSSVSPSTAHWIAPRRFNTQAAIPLRGDVFPDLDSKENDDPVLQRYRCAIGLETPIQVVMDPNGVALYERKNILEWFHKSATSPVTRDPLQIAQLKPNWAIQAIIDHRRDFIRRQNEKNKELNSVD